MSFNNLKLMIFDDLELTYSFRLNDTEFFAKIKRILQKSNESLRQIYFSSLLGMLFFNYL